MLRTLMKQERQSESESGSESEVDNDDQCSSNGSIGTWFMFGCVNK